MRAELLIPEPPAWVTDASQDFLDHVATPLYWLLAVTSFAVWAVLRWQRQPGESRAAKALRAFTFSKTWLWLVLAVTRWVAPAWRLPLYDVVTVAILATTLWMLAALVATYVLPAFRHRGETPSGLEGDVLPEAKAWEGEERRIGPPDRRKEIGA